MDAINFSAFLQVDDANVYINFMGWSETGVLFFRRPALAKVVIGCNELVRAGNYMRKE